jgi:hypothetical protein
MHEIDSQSDPSAERPLSEVMRRLAASSRQGAPAKIGAGLATAFRQHHTRRRRIRRMRIAGLVACFLAIAGLFFLQRPRTPRPAQNATQAHIEPASLPVQVPEVKQTASIPVDKPKSVRNLSHPNLSHPKVTATKVAYSREFVALPGYDPEVPVADLHIVRVQLPTSTLWQMGAPINPAGPDRRVLADFVVNQDGTPYGVRLVHTTIF